MIQSFRCEETRRIYLGEASRKFPPAIQERARLKLRQIAAATRLETLRVPPSNRLEALTGNRKGQWSIRVNDQWRICFTWEGQDAHNVEITDYH